MLKRFGLLIVVNFAVVATLMVVLNLLGVRGYITPYGIDYNSLMVFCLVWGMGGAFISLLISKQMAKWMMNLYVIDPDTTNPMERRLINMVGRLAQVSNLPRTPEVAIYNSPEVNAFATGPSKGSALVAVSSGLMQNMDSDELEGVLAHEVSHIANGDMVTMTLVQGVMNAFVMFLSKALAWIIANSMSQSRDGENGRPSYLVAFMVEMVLYVLFGLVAGLVVAWFSRWREFRADRDGAKIAGTGKMIAALDRLRRVYQPEAASFSGQEDPMMSFKISGGKRAGWLELFSSHPPLDERIRRLQEHQF